jgi:hypothetical protein
MEDIGTRGLMTEKGALAGQYSKEGIGAGAVNAQPQTNLAEEAAKPLEVLGQPGAMANIDPEIQKQSDEMAMRMRGLVETQDQSIMSGYVKSNMEFIRKLKAKYAEARDTMQDPALAEKYQNMINDHLAMNQTLQNVIGPGGVEKMMQS